MMRGRVAYAGAIHEAYPDANGVRLADGRVRREDEVVWLAPIEVGTIFALGLNYAEHAKELQFSKQEEPLVFLKGPGTVIGHRGMTRRPADVTFMHYECELAVVIGRTAQNVKRATAMQHVGGLHDRERLRDPRLPGKLLPSQPAREEPRRRHGARAMVRRCRRCCRRHATRIAHFVNGTRQQRGNTRDLVTDIPA